MRHDSTAMLRREQTRKEIRFCLFRYVSRFRTETVKTKLSKSVSAKTAPKRRHRGYRNGSHVEITGTLFLKRRGDKLYFNLLQTVSIRLPQTRRIFSKEIWHFAVKWAKISRNGKTGTTNPTRCSRHSASRRSMRISSTSGCASSASTGNAKSGCNRVSR